MVSEEVMILRKVEWNHLESKSKWSTIDILFWSNIDMSTPSELQDTDAVDLLIVEKLAPFEKTEDEEEEEVLELNDEDKEKLSKIVNTIRRGSINL